MIATRKWTTAKITGCEAIGCSFNQRGKCRTPGINIGGPEPLCDTYINISQKTGISHARAIVGACRITGCRYNKLLECSAESVRIIFNRDRA